MLLSARIPRLGRLVLNGAATLGTVALSGGTATFSTALGATGGGGTTGRRDPMPCFRMREKTNRLKKCMPPSVSRIVPSLSLSNSMAALEVKMFASVFNASETNPMLMR